MDAKTEMYPTDRETAVAILPRRVSMLRHFLRSKIHGVTVTEANVNYVGSLAIDDELMELCGLQETKLYISQMLQMESG